MAAQGSSRMSDKKKTPSPAPISEEQRSDAQNSELLNDANGAAVAAVLRENAALHKTVGDQRKRLWRVWTVNLVLALTLLMCGSVWFFVFPKYRYIPTSDNRAICEVNSQYSPNIMGPEVTDFAREAVLHAYSYDYANYRQTLNDVADRWFTEDGRVQFWHSLDSSGNLDKVLKGRFILRSAIINEPQLQREGTDDKLRNWWEVVVPIWISFYQNGEQTPTSRQAFSAVVRVVQVPATATNTKGILVDVINLAPYVDGGH
jgi:intracellular multiplication protein IcmL